MDYQEYLQTPHWKEVSAQCRERYDNRCAICGSTEDLNVHHWTYEHLGEEKPWELICLCQSCHERAHSTLDALEEDLYCLYTGRDEMIYQVEQMIIAKAGYKLLGDHHTKNLPAIMHALEKILTRKKRDTYFSGLDAKLRGWEQATQILKGLRTQK